MTFIGCLIESSVPYHSKSASGYLVDDGARFSAIGMTKRRLLRNIDTSSSINLVSIPTALSNYKCRQYGTGSNASNKRKMLGNIQILLI